MECCWEVWSFRAPIWELWGSLGLQFEVFKNPFWVQWGRLGCRVGLVGLSWGSILRPLGIHLGCPVSLLDALWGSWGFLVGSRDVLRGAWRLLGGSLGVLELFL